MNARDYRAEIREHTDDCLRLLFAAIALLSDGQPDPYLRWHAEYAEHAAGCAGDAAFAYSRARAS